MSGLERSPRSNFKNVLKGIPVPAALVEGVKVTRVYATGKTQNCFLTLGNDNFTLYLTAEKYKKNKGFFSSFGSSRRSDQSKDERAVDIGAIDRIQRGHATHHFALAKKSHSSRSLLSSGKGDEGEEVLGLKQEDCFSIIFRGDWTLDLMARPDVNRDEILDTLDRIIQTYKAEKVKVATDVLLLRYVWFDTDKDKSLDTINVSELGRIFDRINYYIKKSQLNDLYEKFGKTIGLDRKQRRQGLTFEQCCTLLHKIRRDSWVVKPVNQYWNSMFGEFMKNGKPRMNVSDKTFLERFLHKSQGETDATIEDVRRLFARLNDLEMPHIADGQPKDPHRIDKNRFEAFLVSKENDAFDPVKEQFDSRTLNKPISEYWINSSHNTYLTGDQLTSSSSVEMYSNALYRGCRCLELDIWDGDMSESGPVPVIWHGHTMTSKILFKDIIKTIKLYLNFHPDTFPIILSFENHCSIPYQEVMAAELVQILGHSLYIPTEASLNGLLPSPLELRGMVVIKGRRPAIDAESGEITDDDSEDEGKSSYDYGDGTKSATAQSQQSVHHGISPALARLTLFHGTKLKSWDESVRNPTHHMHSFSESKVRSICKKKDGRKWAIYNQSHMSRSYPSGSRVDSSNYVPILAWSVGCQLVALNFQTQDASLRLNDGRFRENGGCGYVLKPLAMMEMHETLDEPAVPMRLTIRVLSGSCLPKPRDQKIGECIDPYVRVSVFDVKSGFKEVSSSFSTTVRVNNGFSPIWNEDKFSFTVENWAVAMLQLTVFDKDIGTDDFIASASIPIACLRKGLRSVKLFDGTNTTSGSFDFASLLIEVKTEKALAEI